jgi:transcriptional regulator with XRE-family HTH domain
MVDMLEVGRKIAERRKALGLTQEEFGRRLNVTHQAVSKWEQGVSLPDTALLPALSAVLQLPIDEILGAERQAIQSPSKPARKLRARRAAAVGAVTLLAIGTVVTLSILRASRMEGRFIRLGPDVAHGDIAEAISASPRMVIEIPDSADQAERVDQHVFRLGDDHLAHVVLLAYANGRLVRSDEYAGTQLVGSAMYEYVRTGIGWVYHLDSDGALSSAWHRVSGGFRTDKYIEYGADGRPTGRYIDTVTDGQSVVVQVKVFAAGNRLVRRIVFGDQSSDWEHLGGADSIVLDWNDHVLFQVSEFPGQLSASTYLAMGGELAVRLTDPHASEDLVLGTSSRVMGSSYQDDVGEWHFERDVQIPVGDEFSEYLRQVSARGYYDPSRDPWSLGYRPSM